MQIFLCKPVYRIFDHRINCKTMESRLDINGHLVLNKDQDEFRKLAESAVKQLTKRVTVDGNKVNRYSDFVLTIEASPDKRSFKIYRNRTSMLVLAEQAEQVISISFEYIFVIDHLNYLLKGKNG